MLVLSADAAHFEAPCTRYVEHLLYLQDILYMTGVEGPLLRNLCHSSQRYDRSGEKLHA